jgi:hypothetical protein
MLYDENVDEQCLLDTLESIEGEIEGKADGYAKIINELKGQAEIIKAEKERLAARQKTFESRAKWLKDNLQQVMTATGKTKFKTDLFSFGIQANGGVQALTIDGDVPDTYKKLVEDTDKIRTALEAGTTLEFAHLEPRGESLRIR